MHRTSLRALVVAAAFGAAAFTAAPALADDVPPPAPTCDATALSAAVDTAATAEHDARTAFTSFTSTSMKALAAQFKHNHGDKGQHLNRHQALVAVKAQRSQLKTAWRSAQTALQAAEAELEACQASPTPAP